MAEPERAQQKATGDQGAKEILSRSPYAGDTSRAQPVSRSFRGRVGEGRPAPTRSPGRGNETTLRTSIHERIEADPSRAGSILRKAISDTFAEIGEEFGKKGEKFDTKVVEELRKEAPKDPNFPVIMLSLAIVKDVLDFPMDFILVGTVVAFVLGIFISLVLTIWSWNKMGGWWWKKFIITWFWKTFVFAVLVEVIPFLQLIPATTILVLMTHYREKKVVKLLNFALERMHESGILKYI